jgi:hypothetical protein
LVAAGSSASAHGELNLLDAATGKLVRKAEQLPVSADVVLFAADSKLLAVADATDCCLLATDSLRDATKAERPRRFQLGGYALAFAPGEKVLAACGPLNKEGSIEFYDLADWLDDKLQDPAGEILKVNGSIEREGERYRVELAVKGRRSTAALARIKDLPRPLALVLSHSTSLTDESLGHVAGCRQIKAVELEDVTDITDAGLRHLATLPKLEELSLKGAEKITDAALPYFKAMRGLRSLRLGRTAITEAGQKRIRQSLPTVAVDMDR